MQFQFLEHAAAMLSSMRRTSVLLLQLGVDFGDMDGMMVRDLADLRPIITQEAFDGLCSRQHAMITAERADDFDQIKWMVDVLQRIVPSCGAPVTVLYFADGTLLRVVTSTEYSVPAGIRTAPDARQAA